jgi:c-di-GMP-binding flagellar brake protein YcgR
MQVMTWILWSLLLTGLALVCGDLWRSAMRFREWRCLRAEHEGEIVLGDAIVQAGQVVSLRPLQSGSRPTEGTLLPAYVASVEKKLLTLALEPASGSDPRGLQRNAVIGTIPAWPLLGTLTHITLIGEDALYRFCAPVRDVRVDTRKPGQRLLVVERPTWMARIQRRQHVRAPIHLPVAFERTGEESRDRPHTALPGTVIELSAGGFQANMAGVHSLHEADMLLRTFPPGTVLRVRLASPGLAETPLLARVRLSGKAVVRGGIGVRVACEFLPMASWEQDLLVQYVFRAQRDWLQERALTRRSAA